MPVVLEPLTQAEMDSYGSHLRGPIYVVQSNKVIDRERNVVLLHFGGKGDEGERTGEPPDYFNLLVNNRAVAFEGYYGFDVLGKYMAMNFDVREFSMPSDLSGQRQAIESDISAALAVYWSTLYERPIRVWMQFPAVDLY